MKVSQIRVKTIKREEIIDITDEVKKIVSESKIRKGICIVYCPHTTAAITINENADPDVKEDIMYALKKIVPEIGYKHMEGNSDGHVKSSLIGISEIIIFEDSELRLGRWQGICFCEFDGPRSRKLYIRFQ